MREFIQRPAGGIPEGGICAETDPEVFYPEQGGSTREAKRLCDNVCKVKDECLDGALERGERFGIWGGLTAKELRKLGKTAVS